MEEKTVDSLIKDIVNSVTGTEVTVDEQQVQSLFHQIAPNLAILCVRILVAIILWLVGKKLMRWLNNIVDAGWKNNICAKFTFDKRLCY